jgi:hypothetical protein
MGIITRGTYHYSPKASEFREREQRDLRVRVRVKLSYQRKRTSKSLCLGGFLPRERKIRGLPFSKIDVGFNMGFTLS